MVGTGRGRPSVATGPRPGRAPMTTRTSLAPGAGRGLPPTVLRSTQPRPGPAPAVQTNTVAAAVTPVPSTSTASNGTLR